MAGKLEYFLNEITGQNGEVYITYFLGQHNDNFVTKIKHGSRFKKFQKVIDDFFQIVMNLWKELNQMNLVRILMHYPKLFIFLITTVIDA
ncbi:hypothetical protein ACWGOQ_0008985 [Aquimarina sp. M1]